MAPHQQQFQKFKDKTVKKPIKRLRHRKAKENKFSYTQKLANSLKRRALSGSRNSLNNISPRKLNFSNAKGLRRQPQEQTKTPVKQLKEQVEKAEMMQDIEEIESSDDDDCIVLDSFVENISILDDSSDNESVSLKSNLNSNDDIPTTSRFVIDKVGQYDLSYQTNNSITCDIKENVIKTSSKDKSHLKNLKFEPQKISAVLDDSVILIEDYKEGDDFIPLSVNGAKSPKRERREKQPKVQVTPKVMKPMNESLFTSTERKKLDDYNSNTYNPGTSIAANPTKRAIIIDGSNVAFGHGFNVFSVEGIKYCVDYFEKMGHDVKVVIPSFRRNPHKSSNPELLDQLQREKKIVLTPCKNVLNQQSISYDDRFILQLAYERNAAIVSNDNYRDLVHENPAFKKIIQNRVIGYSWCDDILILPKDPYGRFGPQLDEILRC